MNGKRLPIHAKGKSNTPPCSTVESMWTMKESGSCPGARLRMINLFSHMSPWSPPSRSRRQRKLQIPTSASSSSCPTACAGRRSSVAPTPRCSRQRITTTRSVADLQHKYLADTPEQRRRELMPFLWSTLVPQGQILGDRDAGSEDQVANGFNFPTPVTARSNPRCRSRAKLGCRGTERRQTALRPDQLGPASCCRSLTRTRPTHYT